MDGAETLGPGVTPAESRVQGGPSAPGRVLPVDISDSRVISSQDPSLITAAKIRPSKSDPVRFRGEHTHSPRGGGQGGWGGADHTHGA